MDKRLLLIGLVIAAALGAGIFAWNVRGRSTSTAPVVATTPSEETPKAAATPNAAAIISELDGDATVTHAGASSTAEVGMELEEGDEVSVDANGTMSITFPTYGKMLVASSTNLIIRSLKSDEEHSSLIVNLKLTVGRVWTRLERLLGSNDVFDIRASNVVATVRGTSYGVLVDGPRVDVSVAEHQVKVREVRDREATDEERASGISDLLLEEFTGLESDVREGQGVNINLVAGVSMESMFQPRALDPSVLNDPFVQRGNRGLTPEELRGVSDVTMSGLTGMIDWQQYMIWVQDLIARYPNGDIPPEAIAAFFREHGIPMDDQLLDHDVDPQALREYMQSLGVQPTE